MKVRYLQPALTSMLALIMMFVAASSLAAEKTESGQAHGPIASTWLMWVKNGQAQQFQEAIKAHAAWRKQEGESFTWSVFQPVAGSDLSYYVVRTDGHHWKDFDANAAWEQEHDSTAQFRKQVGPYIQRMEHYFDEDDSKHSHWIPSKDYRYFGVTDYHFKPGSRATVKGVMDKIQKAVTDAKWPYSYAISHTIGGSGGVTIVEPMKSYADMADPEPSMMDILAKSLGSKKAAKAAMQDFGSSIKHYQYTVYVYRPDLSTPSE
jgi:hypothetical protein